MQAELGQLLTDWVQANDLCVAGGLGSPSCAAAVDASAMLFDLQEQVGTMGRAQRMLSGFYPFCLMLRLFKAFSAQPRLAIVTQTMAEASNDLAHFGIVFFSIFFVYVAMGMAFFGREVPAFSSFDRAVLSLFRALMGDFSVEDMEASGRDIAFVFFGSYMAIAVMLLLNMLIAIIMDVYATVANRSRNGESLWNECSDIAIRAYENWKGERVTLANVSRHCMAAWGEDALESKEVVFINSVLDAVPGLSATQLSKDLSSAVQEWASENTLETQLHEVLEEVGQLSALWLDPQDLTAPATPALSLEAVNPKLAHSPASDQTDLPYSDREQTLEGLRQTAESRQQSAQLLVDQGVSCETLLRAAALTLEKRFEDRGRYPARAEALQHLLSSAEIICAGDDLLECKM